MEMLSVKKKGKPVPKDGPYRLAKSDYDSEKWDLVEEKAVDKKKADSKKK